MNSPATTSSYASPAATPEIVYDGIYHDLKEGFRLMEAGRPEAEAVFEWRLLFWSHWGYHLAEALRVIHYYVALCLGPAATSEPG
jgi:hypothetical protein